MFKRDVKRTEEAANKKKALYEKRRGQAKKIAEKIQKLVNRQFPGLKVYYHEMLSWEKNRPATADMEWQVVIMLKDAVVYSFDVYFGEEYEPKELGQSEILSRVSHGLVNLQLKK
ncbi:hypothetical protein A2380_00710 [candidate division WWE3 bacterium RIFOXYB1_FULL_43_24]|uniref:Uncharacterized protein n=1 Tax=candidate division WWE3 bacterium GW2011_GWF1_42_14 TaxID=1619138 RepID=A0A0G0YRF9_UNCKA|nr:MAG: hypothetical protein UU97_C0017G0011 [candidate division WWE3 bacterium GW2011_GWD1_42_14]KKS39237.1 MAG: hypothetical protein UV00_C0003G0069 [candidate division WWE3 bacterium GW2011_GWF1_42_14]KKS40735.1 MAG: hypothetical protein UV03_C0003G0048 [candidate division WWE3 bacterium GW2011_GWE1_42_16]OGC59462.1 MAG: hypothetical protein A2212_01100 [candidate division WWE3 bacterium RIFOXYA1_FULL_42_9]OGC69465.1 MAG: hypothetical protein A2380_00710 [candidate division WWE3 bacterium RI